MKNDTSIEPLEPRIAPATIFVTTTADTGDGSLRKAIIEANATPAADIIAFKLPVGSTIVLTSGDLDVTAPLSVKGPGADKLAISGNNATRIFNVADNLADQDSRFIVSGLTLTKGSEPDTIGGAIYSTESLTVKNCVFTANTAKSGGGIYVNGTALNKVLITGSTFTANKAIVMGDGGGGGAMCLEAGKGITISKTTAIGNHAEFGGGGIYMNFKPDADPTAKATISGSTFRGNTSFFPLGQGAAIYAIMDSHAMLITKTDISGNSARLNGGGLSVFEGDLTMTASTVTNNTTSTTGEGGGMFLRNTNAKLSAVRVTGNTCGGDGGGIAVTNGGSLFLKSTTLRANHAAEDGGGIHFASAQSLTAIAGVIADNTATFDGGGIASHSGGKLTLKGTAFLGNRATSDGGALSLTTGTTLDLIGGTYESNTGTMGGAIYGTGTGAVVIKGAKFLTNRAINGDGGCIYLSNNFGTTVEKTLFKGNRTSGSGGAFYLTGSGAYTITSATVLDNVASNSNNLGNGGGFALASSTSVGISQSLFKGNFADVGGGISCITSFANIASTIITGNLAKVNSGGIFKNANSTVAPTVKILANIAPVNPDKNF